MSADGDKMPVGVYIHIPFCRAKCAYCTFVSTPDASLQKAYVDALVREIYGAEKCSADTVYIGGGTPSCLFSGAISKILSAVRSTFCVDEGAEITVEANPESVTPRFLDECLDAGVNRLSIGLQSSDDRILKAIGRIHTFSDFLSAVKRAETSGFKNISSDMIIGLPQQDFSDADRCIDVFSEHCTHASVYALSVEAGTPIQRSGYTPDDDAVADLYDHVVNKLARNGFNRYEVSNFARSGRESRHNKKYWQCLPYVGFGVAAHGYDGEYVRYRHTDDIKQYIDGAEIIPTRLSEKDRYNEYIMLALRTERGIVLDEFYNRFGFKLEESASALRSLISSGLVKKENGCIRIAPERMFVMNGIIEELMI